MSERNVVPVQAGKTSLYRRHSKLLFLHSGLAEKIAAGWRPNKNFFVGHIWSATQPGRDPSDGWRLQDLEAICRVCEKLLREKFCLMGDLVETFITARRASLRATFKNYYAADTTMGGDLLKGANCFLSGVRAPYLFFGRVCPVPHVCATPCPIKQIRWTRIRRRCTHASKKRQGEK